jgi:hypothetical protein
MSILGAMSGLLWFRYEVSSIHKPVCWMLDAKLVDLIIEKWLDLEDSDLITWLTPWWIFIIWWHCWRWALVGGSRSLGVYPTKEYFSQTLPVLSVSWPLCGKPLHSTMPSPPLCFCLSTGLKAIELAYDGLKSLKSWSIINLSSLKVYLRPLSQWWKVNTHNGRLAWVGRQGIEIKKSCFKKN